MAEDLRPPHARTLLASSSRFSVIALAAAGVLSGAISGESKTNCGEAYNSFLKKLDRKQLSPERRAALHRWARRMYDACDTGDLDDAKALFERLEREGY
jgi:hypothetical protein